MKKILCMVVLFLVLLGFSYFSRAGVQVRNVSVKQYRFDLKAGERIIIVDMNIEGGVRTRVTPTEARIFDYKIPEGKKLTGVLNLK